MTKILLFFFAVFFLSACTQQAIYREDQNTPNGWALNDTLRFKIDQSLAKPANIYIHLRNNHDYPFANIFLVVNRQEGDSLFMADTLEYAMATPSGEWLGTGFSSVKENKLEWKTNWQPHGDSPYVIEIAQANRSNGKVKGADNLAGIVSVGVSIEHQNNE